jgi:hypothetical protein
LVLSTHRIADTFIYAPKTATVSLPQTAKKKKRRTDLHTPAESDTESESDLVTAKSSTLTSSSDPVHSKSTNVRKVKEKVKPSTSKQKPVPESFYKTEYMKPLKGMDLSFPQGANVFSASPWGMMNDTGGWNDFLVCFNPFFLLKLTRVIGIHLNRRGVSFRHDQRLEGSEGKAFHKKVRGIYLEYDITNRHLCVPGAEGVSNPSASTRLFHNNKGHCR